MHLTVYAPRIRRTSTRVRAPIYDREDL
jgi:hypothetical protein